MRAIILFIVCLVLILWERPIRRIVLHSRVLRFLRIVLYVAGIFLFIGILALAYWYRRTYVLPALPKTSWSDTTLEQDLNPDTPQSGGRTITPTIIR